MLNILIVDDDPSVRELLSDALAGSYNVMSSDDRGEAKTALLTKGIDLLFLDVWLNGKDTSNLLYWVRDHPDIDCTCILITADDSFVQKYLEKLHEVADNILVKPFDIYDAIKVASRALEKKVESINPKHKEGNRNG